MTSPYHHPTRNFGTKLTEPTRHAKLKNNIENCFAEKDRLVAEMTNNLSDVKKISKSETFKHPSDKTGDSSVTDVIFKFKSRAQIIIACYNWSEKISKEKKWIDHLRISVRDKSYVSFLKNAN